MLRVLLYLLAVSVVSVNLTGCYTLRAAGREVVETSEKYNGLHIQKIDQAEIQEFVFNKELRDLPPVALKPTVAIYSFADLTGQRKPSENLSSFSTAVTQAPEVFLIRALRGAGYGEVFQVVERKGLENLSKERQLIKSTRESYEGDAFYIGKANGVSKLKEYQRVRFSSDLDTTTCKKWCNLNNIIQIDNKFALFRCNGSNFNECHFKFP